MGFSLGHLLILAVVGILFGSRRLPELASAVGKAMHSFREAYRGREEIEDHKSGQRKKRLGDE